MTSLQTGSLRSVDQGTAKAMLRGSLLGPVAFLAGAVGFGFVELQGRGNNVPCPPTTWSAAGGDRRRLRRVARRDAV